MLVIDIVTADVVTDTAVCRETEEWAAVTKDVVPMEEQSYGSRENERII